MIAPLTCPICDKPLPPEAGTKLATLPFCSVRCRQVDFFRWCDGKYAIVEPVAVDDPDRASLAGASSDDEFVVG